MATTLAALVAGLSLLAFVLLVAAAGGFRSQRSPVASAAAPQPTRNLGVMADVRALWWRALWVTLALRTIVVVALGLTPAGSALVRAFAPTGNSFAVAAAWLVVLALAFCAGLPTRRWLRQADALAPGRRRGLVAGRKRQALLLADFLVLLAGLAALQPGRMGGPVLAILAWGSLAFIVYAGAVVAFKAARVDKVEPPAALVAAVDRLTELLGSERPRVAAGSLGGRPPGLYAVNTNTSNRLIVASPVLVDLLSEDELTAGLAHEAAHVERRDTVWITLRLTTGGLCAVAVGIAATGSPALQTLAGVSHPGQGDSLPLLVATAYLAYQLLVLLGMRASRAMEIRADQRMLAIVGSPEPCTGLVRRIDDFAGVPDRWTFAQRAFMATHPGHLDRLAGLEVRPAATA
jgi:Zn-dependent protease with chaperone function